MFSSRGIRSLLSLRRLLHSTPPRDGKKLPDPWDLMTGPELFYALEHAKGNIDPFHTLPIRRGPGTKDCPNVIYSFMDKRVVGCVCYPEANHIVYFTLTEGYPRRCNCNYWFVLERLEEPPIYKDCE